MHSVALQSHDPVPSHVAPWNTPPDLTFAFTGPQTLLLPEPEFPLPGNADEQDAFEYCVCVDFLPVEGSVTSTLHSVAWQVQPLEDLHFAPWNPAPESTCAWTVPHCFPAAATSIWQTTAHIIATTNLKKIRTPVPPHKNARLRQLIPVERPLSTGMIRTAGASMLLRTLRILTLLIVSAIVIATPAVRPAAAASAASIDEDVEGALRRFYNHVPGARELVSKAYGVLVFPAIVKAGFGFGGEYGEGALLVNNQWGGYYNSVSASVGFQLGVSQRTVVIAFMTERALTAFRRSYGWKIGVDGSVSIITLGAGASIDTSKIAQPIVGFIFDSKGLMYNLTLEGSKITQISR